jgi:two-component system chemotaxis response regulator CheB
MIDFDRDPREGPVEMRKASARTFAQDEATSVVYGMPRACVARGAATSSGPLERLGAIVTDAVSR